MTTVYVAEYDGGAIQPGDDLSDVMWVPITGSDFRKNLAYSHKKMLDAGLYTKATLSVWDDVQGWQDKPGGSNEV